MRHVGLEIAPLCELEMIFERLGGAPPLDNPSSFALTI
jgi:hypothetical protein